MENNALEKLQNSRCHIQNFHKEILSSKDISIEKRPHIFDGQGEKGKIAWRAEKRPSQEDI